MTERWPILREFGSKLRQVHVSVVNREFEVLPKAWFLMHQAQGFAVEAIGA
jgi:hypothetical protein